MKIKQYLSQMQLSYLINELEGDVFGNVKKINK